MREFPVNPGLTLGECVSTEWRIEVACDTAASSFLRLIWWLPRSFELSFYDQYFPGSPNDPGAYVDVQRKHDRFLYRMGNHGWSTEWQAQSPDFIAAWMALNLTPKPTVNEPLKGLRLRTDATLPETFRSITDTPVR